MKEIKLSGLDQSVLYKKLDNGLDVYFIPYKNKTNYTMHYVAKYGSRNTNFKALNSKEIINLPDGIAHFLEHKMFEQEDGVDPFTFAAKTGTSSNATTSFKTTRYFFEGNTGFEENLDYLLTFVNSPYFTDENVDKEKGIIGEEIKQYDDEVEWFLDEELRKAIFEKDSVRNDIAGTIESISKITKELLYQTHEIYYQPSNMILVISGNFDPDIALKVIQNNQALNSRTTNHKIEEKKIVEPTKVFEKEKELEFNIVNPKVAYAIKIPLEKIKDKYLFCLYLGLFNNIKFGLSSEFRERMKQKKLMTSFYTEREIYGDYLIMVFVANSEKPKELISEIKHELNNFNISETEIERLKKVWISSEVIMIDDIAITLDNILYDIINYGKVIDNKVEIFKKLNLKELEKVIKSIDFDNASSVVINPKKV